MLGTVLGNEFITIMQKEYIRESIHGDLDNKCHLRDASSMRCIIYEMHHLQDLDLWDASRRRCIISKMHQYLHLHPIVAILVHV